MKNSTHHYLILISMVHKEYYTLCYNGNIQQILRHNIHDKWGILFNIGKQERPAGTLKSETLLSCELMYDRLRRYTPVINLFFSGGMDSECILKCFAELKIPVRAIIIQHKYIPDMEETINAIKVCDQLAIPYELIPIDLFSLYNTGRIIDLGIKYQTSHPAMIQLLHVIDMLHEPAIVCDDIRLVKRASLNSIDRYSINWYYEINESDDAAFYKYMYITGLPIISDTFRYTPQQWLSMISEYSIKDIVYNNRRNQGIVHNNKGLVSSNSTKNKMMGNAFNVKYRKKIGISVMSPYASLFRKIKEDIEYQSLPFRDVELEYNTLLNILS